MLRFLLLLFCFCFETLRFVLRKLLLLGLTPLGYEEQGAKDEDWTEEEVRVWTVLYLWENLQSISWRALELGWLKLSQLKQRGQVFVHSLRPFFECVLDLGKGNNFEQGNCSWQFLGRDAAVSCQEPTLLGLVLKAESGGIPQYSPLC